MKNDLRTALVQTYLHWENPAANRMHLAGWLEQIKPGEADLVVLPEVFTTGFSMAASRIAEPFSGSMDTLQWMRVWASQLDAVITGSVAVIEQGKCYNRLLWVRPDGTFTHYDKRHLFRMAAEDQSYTAGQERIIEEWRGWKICPLICYDLRFPVWSRNGMVSGEPLYDVLIYIANWPSARRDPWMKLAVARAIENQCYVLAVNRTGDDGHGIPHSGDSSVIDARGQYVQVPDATEGIIRAQLSVRELDDFRKSFPVLLDADSFHIS
ncbi:MAG: amidohydrolase [Flavobacteriales bacterium]|jgi:omega-amidase